MANIHLCSIVALNNPASFNSSLEFEITFECLQDLPEDLEWKLIYVGSAKSTEFDQILDTIYVGPVPEGRHKFVFSTDPPNPTKIPVTDIVGVTVILLTCSYKSKEFIRVGYYVRHEYEDLELAANPPEIPIIEKLTRNILDSNPRVTKFRIAWHESEPDQNPEKLLENLHLGSPVKNLEIADSSALENGLSLYKTGCSDPGEVDEQHPHLMEQGEPQSEAMEGIQEEAGEVEHTGEMQQAEAETEKEQSEENENKESEEAAAEGEKTEEIEKKEGETEGETEKKEGDVPAVEVAEPPKFMSDEEYYENLDPEELIYELRALYHAVFTHQMELKAKKVPGVVRSTEAGENFLEENLTEAFNIVDTYRKALDDVKEAWEKANKVIDPEIATSITRKLRKIYAITKTSMVQLYESLHSTRIHMGNIEAEIDSDDEVAPPAKKKKPAPKKKAVKKPAPVSKKALKVPQRKKGTIVMNWRPVTKEKPEQI